MYGEFSRVMYHVQVERMPYYLSKEESDDRLLTHLRHHQVLDKLPLLRWFQQCFAGVLPIGCYERCVL